MRARMDERYPVTRTVIVVAILVVLAAGSTAGATHVFGDVDDTRFYGGPVEWAATNGITTGTSATTFEPDRPVTRGESVTFLKRYHDTLGAVPGPTGPQGPQGPEGPPGPVGLRAVILNNFVPGCGLAIPPAPPGCLTPGLLTLVPTCAVGELSIGGGYDDLDSAAVTNSAFVPGAWTVSFTNFNPIPDSVRAYVACLDETP